MVGGLIVSQALTLFTTPVIYLYLDQVSDWIARRRSDTPSTRSSGGSGRGSPGSVSSSPGSVVSSQRADTSSPGMAGR